jgi:sensor c-di-GMP phosphodiesterase-like protein
LGDWLRANADCYIGINVPPEVLGRGGIEYAAMKSGLIELAPRLMMEITERGIPDAIGMESIRRARALGVKVALDDVTLVGGANLAILARCEFDAIKLDKSLTDQIAPGQPEPQWLATVKMIAAASPLEVIVEGVETEHQVAALRAARIPVAQGYYFSRPIPAPEFIAFHLARCTQSKGS